VKNIINDTYHSVRIFCTFLMFSFMGTKNSGLVFNNCHL